MSSIEQILRTHPHPALAVAADALARCIEALQECVATCTACADACLEQDDPRPLVACIKLDLDAADLCGAASRVLLRHAGHDEGPVLRKQLEAVLAVVSACAAECDRHAARHEHCRVCAEACRRCEATCRDLLARAPRLPLPPGVDEVAPWRPGDPAATTSGRTKKPAR
jgi:hypothetical protein